MRVVFISNYYNHHQRDLCRFLNKKFEGKFFFIETTSIPEERKKLGYESINDIFVVNYNEKKDKIYKIINEADVFILGNINKEIETRVYNTKKDIYIYSERIYKKTYKYLTLPLRFLKYRKYNRSNVYLLAASSYAYKDYKLTGNFKGRAYKFGYFPSTEKIEDINKFMENKKKNSIIWVGRLIKLKNPEIILDVAEYLKNKKIDFSIDIIGDGELKEYLLEQINLRELYPYITLHGAVSLSKVRESMKKSSIFFTTSNKEEGWGAVVNEAMSSACCVVSSKYMGATNYLIKNKKNGYIFDYKEKKALFNIIEFCLLNDKERKQMGIEAYNTIDNLWNPEEAANRLANVIKNNFLEKENIFYNDGPLSKA